MSPSIEPLATLPLDKRRGQNCELRLTKVTIAKGDTLIAVGLFPAHEDIGVTIGVGPSRSSALADAQNTLQAALDSVDVAILKSAGLRS